MGMRTKNSFKYQFQEVWQSIGILYLVQVGMRLLALFLASKVGGEHVTMTGMNVMSAMFMLIIGMCTFTESFQFLLQNGVSRKQILAGKLLGFAVGAGMCGVADTLLGIVDQKLSGWGKIQFGGEILPLFYPEFLDGASFVTRVVVTVALLFVVYALFAVAGCVVSIIWYRLNKVGRLVFAFGVPAVIWFIYPIADYFLFGGKSMIAIMNAVMKLSGITDGNPFYGFISGIAALAILAGLSALLIRKTVVRREN